MNDPEAPSPLHRLKRWLRPVMLLAALAFVLVAAREVTQRWTAQPLAVNPWLLLASVLPLLLGLGAQAFAWIALIEELAGRRVPRAEAAALHLESQLGRYTPGKLALPAIRVAGADRIGLGGRVVGVSVLLEVLPWSMSGVGLGGLLLWLCGARATDALTRGTPWLAAVAGGLGALVLGGLVVTPADRLPQRLRGVLGLNTAPTRLLPLASALAFLACQSAWFFHALLLALAFGASPATALEGTGVIVIAPAIGFLALVAPAGAGIREAVYLLGLAPLVGGQAALAMALASRGASVIADVGAWALAAAVARWTRPVASSSNG